MASGDNGGLGSCHRSRSKVRGKGGKRVIGLFKLRIASWNIGSLTGKSIELVKYFKRRHINIARVQETRWVGTKARDVDGFKLWYSGGSKDRNGISILVDETLRDYVVEVRRVNDRMMFIKLVVSRHVVNVVSAYAPQVGLDGEVKRLF